MLSTFLGTLAQDANLCIVSRNSSSVIRKALASVDWLRYFVVIYGAEDFDVSVPKSQVIGDLMSLHRKEVDEVLFIDDMFLNVSDVSQHCHVATLHIRTPGGMDVWDCEYILAWARSKKEDLKIPEWSRLSRQTPWVENLKWLLGVEVRKLNRSLFRSVYVHRDVFYFYFLIRMINIHHRFLLQIVSGVSGISWRNESSGRFCPAVRKRRCGSSL